MSYLFHPAAETEHLESVAFYESKQPGLGAAYLTEFENVMKRVCEGPQRYPIEMKPDIRRIRMNRFPFTVLYREKDGIVQILAIAHQRRRPQYWLGRL
ncbi:MAG: type II toxin-antitoxin system RelE/ParE family toxin [bacterium]